MYEAGYEYLSTTMLMNFYHFKITIVIRLNRKYIYLLNRGGRCNYVLLILSLSNVSSVDYNISFIELLILLNEQYLFISRL